MISYEIAYLLTPDATPEEAMTAAGGITRHIEQAGGVVHYVAEPKKRKLAFLVKKRGHAYFGFTNFILKPEQCSALKKAVSFDANIMRFLIVRALKPNQPVMDRGALRAFRADTRKRDDAVFKRPQPSPKEESKITTEEIDKKLEEILNK